MMYNLQYPLIVLNLQLTQKKVALRFLSNAIGQYVVREIVGTETICRKNAGQLCDRSEQIIE